MTLKFQATGSNYTLNFPDLVQNLFRVVMKSKGTCIRVLITGNQLDQLSRAPIFCGNKNQFKNLDSLKTIVNLYHLIKT